MRSARLAVDFPSRTGTSSVSKLFVLGKLTQPKGRGAVDCMRPVMTELVLAESLIVRNASVMENESR